MYMIDFIRKICGILKKPGLFWPGCFDDISCIFMIVNAFVCMARKRIKWVSFNPLLTAEQSKPSLHANLHGNAADSSCAAPNRWPLTNWNPDAPASLRASRPDNYRVKDNPPEQVSRSLLPWKPLHWPSYWGSWSVTSQNRAWHYWRR